LSVTAAESSVVSVGPHRRRDGVVVFGVALALRLLVVVWAGSSFPPSADGTYYNKLAIRIAEGHGYTWLWDDGAVTYAAHYPVGYPAMLALGYVIFGAKPIVAMIFNALIGALASVSLWSVVARQGDLAPSEGSRARWSVSRETLALLAGLALAIHPVFVPYTAAIMTEGVTASLLVIATALAARARDEASTSRRRGLIVATGLVMGAATLVRPQSLALAPILGWLALPSSSTRKHRALASIAVLMTTLAVCAPWTARNCVRMEKCALVSVNGGWNLAIGTQTDNGGWHEIAVPAACREVFQEAAKDECFRREAMKVIAAHPIAWLARAPAKLRVTFDYFGAAPWYLHDANKERFPYRAKVALGAIETLASRLLLAAALVTVFRMRRASSTALDRARKIACVVGLVACVAVPGVIGYLALAVGILLLGRRALAEVPLVVPFTSAIILVTAATHAAFFGAGRYGMVVVPFVTAVAFVRFSARVGLAKTTERAHPSAVGAVQAIVG